MLSSIFLTLTATAVPAPVPAPAPTFVQEDEVDAKIAACGEDVAKLEALAAAFEEAEDKSAARAVYQRILEVDDTHEAAHKKLRHHFYDGQWFTSYASLSKYRREEAKRMKEEFGLVRYNDEWVPETDLPFLRMGWEKVGETYVDPVVALRTKQREEAVAQEYQQRAEDSIWIAPADFDKWTQGLYLVDGEWVTKAEANAYHAEIATPWKYQGQHFEVWTTNDVDAAGWVRYWADQTYPQLVRLYGAEPDQKPVVACLNSLAQYNNFAAGDQAAQRQPTESNGFSSCHFAYLGDVWINVFPIPEDMVQEGQQPFLPEYIGGGVSFYDVNDSTMAAWGAFSVRHAAGLSYASYVDRPWDTISQFFTGGGGGGTSPDAMWEEKRVPKWMTYGGAAFVERYFVDESAENPTEIRAWSFGQLADKGKLSPLEDVFALPLDLGDIEGSTRYIQEAGVLVSFVLDGGCAPVVEAHQRFKDVLKSGAETDEAVAALQQAILDNQDALVAHCGIEVATPEERAAARAASAPVDPANGAGAGSGN